MIEEGFEQHTHEALVHEHRHFHVTHNWSVQGQTFVHLTSRHEHEHDHAPLTHAHFPHQDFESEHEGEAHDHDHGEPVRAVKSAAKRAARKKSTSTAAKKSTRARK